MIFHDFSYLFICLLFLMLFAPNTQHQTDAAACRPLQPHLTQITINHHKSSKITKPQIKHNQTMPSCHGFPKPSWMADWHGVNLETSFVFKYTHGEVDQHSGHSEWLILVPSSKDDICTGGIIFLWQNHKKKRCISRQGSYKVVQNMLSVKDFAWRPPENYKSLDLVFQYNPAKQVSWNDRTACCM